MSKKYDFNKARAIIAQFKDQNIQEASLGMKEDWQWTSETIYEDGICTLSNTDTGEIAGISGSAWATPCIKIEFANGETQIYDCYQTDEEQASPIQILSMKTFARMTGGMDQVD